MSSMERTGIYNPELEMFIAQLRIMQETKAPHSAPIADEHSDSQQQENHTHDHTPEPEDRDA